jgi:hypothetical protein
MTFRVGPCRTTMSNCQSRPGPKVPRVVPGQPEARWVTDRLRPGIAQSKKTRGENPNQDAHINKFITRINKKNINPSHKYTHVEFPRSIPTATVASGASWLCPHSSSGRRRGTHGSGDATPLSRGGLSISSCARRRKSRGPLRRLAVLLAQ